MVNTSKTFHLEIVWPQFQGVLTYRIMKSVLKEKTVSTFQT